MTNILNFPETKLVERRNARNILSKLVNSLGCSDEISAKVAKLIEIMDKNNRNVVKLKIKEQSIC